MNNRQDLAVQFSKEAKELVNTLLRIRTTSNAWQIQNAIARLGEVEYWASMAFTFEPQQKQNKPKEVKFANKK